MIRRPHFLFIAVFLFSATGLAYQIALMRIFSVAQWHHFASMVISLAMLGFGASGTAIALLRTRLVGRESLTLLVSAFLFVISLPLSYAASQKIPFDLLEALVRPSYFMRIGQLYLILAVPFFLLSSCITLAFFLTPRRIGRVYFSTMCGSGVGSAAVVGLLYHFSPERMPIVLMIPALTGLLFLVVDRPPRPAAWAAGVVLLTLSWASAAATPLRISPYKGLSHVLRMPDARILSVAHSPLSSVTAVASSSIRETPGQISSAFNHRRHGPMPEQVGLYFDAGDVSVVHRADHGDIERFAFLGYVTSALPYQLLDEPEVLVIGSGGGTEVWNALYHDAHSVTAVESDPRVFSTIRDHLSEFSGRLYEREDVTPVVADGRGFLDSHPGRFDLIQISLVDAHGTVISGAHAAGENYLATLEAVELYIKHLEQDGLLAMTRWLDTPPRDAIKMFATLVQALKNEGIKDPGRHLAFIRSLNTATLILTRSPLSEERVNAIARFCEDRRFDAVYYPGITDDKTNRFTILKDDPFTLSARALLSPERDAFLHTSPYFLHPATDNRPHFSRFFRWRTLPQLMEKMVIEWLPYVEAGYVILVATAAQAFLVSLPLILVPLFILRKHAQSTGHLTSTLIAFAGLGIAYMFFEIAFIQKLMLYLHYPVYAVSAVLSSFLFFSGLGSWVADHWQDRGLTLLRAAIIGIFLLIIAHQVTLPLFFGLTTNWAEPMKIAASVLFLAPLAFFMGIPFPVLLQSLSNSHPRLLPWAWGVNGFFSVMGAALAVLTAVHAGFGSVVLVGTVCYGVVFVWASRLTRGALRG